MDAQALACGGDLDAALKLDHNTDFEVKTKNLMEQAGPRGRSIGTNNPVAPKIWAIKLKKEIEKAPQKPAEEKDQE